MAEDDEHVRQADQRLDGVGVVVGGRGALQQVGRLARVTGLPGGLAEDEVACRAVGTGGDRRDELAQRRIVGVDDQPSGGEEPALARRALRRQFGGPAQQLRGDSGAVVPGRRLGLRFELGGQRLVDAVGRRDAMGELAAAIADPRRGEVQAATVGRRRRLATPPSAYARPR